MRRLLLLLALPACASAGPLAPEPYCKRLPFDEEVPPGVVGKYEIVGKDARTGKSYAGTLEIARGKDGYVLRRIVQEEELGGEAWAESCSPDEFQVFRARYDAKPKPIELSCYLRFDGDNFTRASCTTLEEGGLEAWYQSHDVFAP